MYVCVCVCVCVYIYIYIYIKYQWVIHHCQSSVELNTSSYSWSLYGRNILLQSPSFKFSRKASSSYSLKLEPPSKQKMKAKRKPLSTPASPSRTREPQCTCMTTEQYARLRAQDPRYKGTRDVASLLTVCLISRNHT